MRYIRERAREEGLSQKTILKEALQVSALESLYVLAESDAITFQGGTCLRLLYGGPRYSEGLDFVVSDVKVLPEIFTKVRPPLEKLGPLFEGTIRARVQKESEKLVRWKVYCETGEPKDTTSISIEFAAYPAYTLQVLPLKVPKGYPLVPLILVRAEAEEEILADKINAIAARRYLKGRDIFDIWLLRSKGVEINGNMIARKLRDYSVGVVKIEEKVAEFTEQQVKRDLATYLPQTYRERFDRWGYGVLLESAREVAREVDRKLR